MIRTRLAGAVVATLVFAGAAWGQGTTVRGVVLADGDPAPDTRVTLFTDDLAFFAEDRTDGAGLYEFAAVADGTYRLGVASRGRQYEQRTVLLAGGTLTQDFGLQPETEPGRWDIIGTTGDEFLDATDIAVLLADGRIFYCHDTTDPILFDPLTGQSVIGPASGSEQGCMNGTLLADGRVLLAGGQDGADPGDFRNAIPWVKTYDPATNVWMRHADMQLDVGRWYPGLARLGDGSLLAIGGGTAPNAERTDTCETLDLFTMEWSFTGDMLTPTEFPPCALLYTGEVLSTWWPPQLYDPAGREWRATGAFVQPNRLWPGHSDHSIVVLADGRVLAAGIVSGPDGNTVMTETYDPATGTWSLGSSPELVRFQCEVVQLPDGRVLVAGGETEDPDPPVHDVLGIVKWSDIHDPAPGTWRRVADMNHFREYHGVSLLLPDGRVAVTGGTKIKFQYGPTSTDVEAYVPPNLLRGVRPRITAISTTEPERGETVEMEVFPATGITAVILMGTPSHTHWVDGGNNRRLVLPAAKAGSTVSFTLPTDPNLLPLGHYMAFAMVDDIPSVARIVNVVEGSCRADFNGDGAVDTRDVLAFLNAWNAGDGRADFNGDGLIDTRDVVAFLNAWNAGC